MEIDLSLKIDDEGEGDGEGEEEAEGEEGDEQVQREDQQKEKETGHVEDKGEDVEAASSVEENLKTEEVCTETLYQNITISIPLSLSLSLCSESPVREYHHFHLSHLLPLFI